jgi:hypothetical protein
MVEQLMNAAEAAAADRWWNLQTPARRVAIRRWLDSPDGREATQVDGQLSIADAVQEVAG